MSTVSLCNTSPFITIKSKDKFMPQACSFTFYKKLQIQSFAVFENHLSYLVTCPYTKALKTQFNLNCDQRLSSYRAVNTLLLGYKNQSVNVV